MVAAWVFPSFPEGADTILRFAGGLLNASGEPLQMHWHGQTKAPADQDRARPDGGMLGPGQTDIHDFELTPGTHWMHAHQLSKDLDGRIR